ncbi:pyruvate carboxyltransferase [Pseudoalteromonas arctica]|uniref:Pyruvate carboxyltransferase n=1 Tax=Pseudoalteromonas arctica TaxID=394751 RepID=A0AAP7CKC9_9GAMM|nr:aldolase catalytic domain-containing protein [Pseudoalteromonas arctica]NMP04234.1 pyruvate carboxyltransferase [Pseudoalteromonas arctica]
MKILDCTLRDGGYYNNWDFEPELVQSYLQAVALSGISYVELGLRNFPKNEFLGPFAYSSENYLKTLELPEGLTYGVMVDAKTILSSQLSIEAAVNALFCEEKNSCVSLVRIAAHFHEVEESKEIANQLKSKGYIVGYNLMQAGGKPDLEIEEKAKEISQWGSVDALYFADSLGNMDANEVQRIVRLIQKHWHGEMGIHTHDNMGRGLANSLTALEAGVEWLDSTVTGMGRGAGNTQTENLMAVLAEKYVELKPNKIYELVIRYFESMQKQYGWGTNLLYFLGAQQSVHPTYIQNLLSNTHIGKDEVVGALQYLLQLNGTSKYDGSVLEAALSLNKNTSEVTGDDVSGLLDGREVLLITNANSVAKHKKALELYIKNNKPIVISLNINKVLDDSFVDYIAITHNLKFLTEKENYSNLSKPIIYPAHRFPAQDVELLADNGNINYGVDIADNTFKVEKTSCLIPSELTIAYGLAFSIAAGANKVTFAGVDGYNSNDSRHLEMIEFFDTIGNDLQDNLEFISITPTTYPIKKGSVYAYI